jgi:hypothetical protein
MGVLLYKHNHFRGACNALNRMIVFRSELHTDLLTTDVNDLFDAGIVHHLEVAYATCWKYLKQYLYDTCGIDAASPKLIFQGCFKANILTEDLANQLIQLADICYQTEHNYDPALAKRVCEQIVTYHHVLDQVLQMTHE